MGLDQFLYKEIYIGGQYEHKRLEGGLTYWERIGETEEENINGPKTFIPVKKIHSVRQHIGTWRKAYAIDQWMSNMDEQNGNSIELDWFQIADLYNVCVKIKNHHDTLVKAELPDAHVLSKQFLPDNNSSYDDEEKYGNMYYEDIEKTIKMLKEEVENRDENEDCYYDYKRSY